MTDQTRYFSAGELKDLDIADMVRKVCEALKEKGYRPLDQIVGYIVSGDPSYITSHKEARQLIRSMDRNDLLEEIVGFYLKSLD